MPKKYQIFYLLATALFLSSGTAGYSQMGGDEDVWQNWDIYITPKALPRYLDHPDSKLVPITQVSISYQQPPRVPRSQYEDLYYTTSQPIGCNRKINPINIQPGTGGVIHITTVSNSEQLYAAANSALRVFLDMSLHSCMTKYVQVPVASFDGLVAALCRSGLHRHSQSGSESGIALMIESDNGERSTMLFQ